MRSWLTAWTGLASTWGRHVLVLALSLAAPVATAAAGDADGLLRRVPSDAGAVLIVEGLAERSDAVLASPLVASLREVPAVRSWLVSDQAKELKRSGRDLASVLGLKSIDELRTEVLGTAVVLSIHLDEGRSADEARGLLLIQPRDRELLERTIARINAIETASGSLRSVQARSRKGLAFSVRRFAPGTKPDEGYVVLPDGAFAWSNSVALIERVIDGAAGDERGVAGQGWFQPLRAGSPPGALATIAIDPRFVERLDQTTEDDRAPSLAALMKALAAMDGWGAALSWRDGPVVETIERYAPGRLAPELRAWAARPGGPEGLLSAIPADAPVVAAGHIDLAAAVSILERLVPEAERPRVDALALVATGLLLGRDARREVLPALGPGAVAYLDVGAGTGGATKPSLVAAIAIDPGARGVPEAIANASRTLLALAVLDDTKRLSMTRRDGPSGVEVIGLTGEREAGPSLTLAAAPGRVVIGSAPEAVEAFLNGTGGFRKPAELGDATSFVLVRVESAIGLVRAREAEVIERLAATGRPAKEVERDLRAVLELLAPFRVAYATSRVTPDGGEARRSLALLGRAP
jgi:hypothetical protein